MFKILFCLIFKIFLYFVIINEPIHSKIEYNYEVYYNGIVIKDFWCENQCVDKICNNFKEFEDITMEFYPLKKFDNNTICEYNTMKGIFGIYTLIISMVLLIIIFLLIILSYKEKRKTMKDYAPIINNNKFISNRERKITYCIIFFYFIYDLYIFLSLFIFSLKINFNNNTVLKFIIYLYFEIFYIYKGIKKINYIKNHNKVFINK